MSFYPHGFWNSWQPRWYQERIQRWGIRLIVPPSAEPISLTEMRLHLRLDDDGDSPPAHPDDPLIQTLMVAAREFCENYIGRAVAPQTFEIAGRAFEHCDYLMHGYGHFIELPMSPVSSIVAVTYTDPDGNPQTVPSSDYLLDEFSDPALLWAKDGTAWPIVARGPNMARVRYIAGYDLPGDSPNINPLPTSIIAAIKLVVGNYYENREAAALLARGESMALLPMGVAALLDPYRLDFGIA